ncbi:MAG: DUF5683 domain-containing protein [Niabella sp.]
MKLFNNICCFSFLLLVFIHAANAQVADSANTLKITADTLIKPVETNLSIKKTDGITIKDPHAKTPGKAALRSAILPGWGQVYNKKIWKVPIVYGVLGVTGWYFFDNLSWYKQLRQGYKVAFNIAQNGDSTGYNNITDYQIKNAVNNGLLNQLKAERDNYRRNVDYSAVYFVIAWALNVIDATVDAHLSRFDISPDLSFHIQPGFSEMANTNGVSLILRFKEQPYTSKRK